MRKKKCDEIHPTCTTCDSLAITCYGYGPKPDWMDNGPKEKEMANSIKQIVKHTSRRKGRLGLSLGHHHRDGGKLETPMISIAPKSTTVSSTNSVTGISLNRSSQKEGSPITPQQKTSVETSQGTLENGDTASSWLPVSIASNEAHLLMHFLDNVFPLQYPMYKPGVTQGGRGWLLSLLLKTKPLYHASLGLAAYRKGVLLYEASSGQCGMPSLEEQEKHLAVCLAKFQQDIKSVGCPVNSLGVMACTIQLVFVELFGVHNSAWQIHLRAAADIFNRAYKEQAAAIGLKLRTDPMDGTSSVTCELMESEDGYIFTFLAGVVIWLDIISCVSTGGSPRLQQLHPLGLSPHSYLQLENIMGCNNWAMSQIGSIASLHELKIRGCQNGDYDPEAFQNQADEIRGIIQRGLTEQFLAKLQISNSDCTQSCNVMTPQATITRVFSLAAYVYLELVITGFKIVEGDSEIHDLCTGS